MSKGRIKATNTLLLLLYIYKHTTDLTCTILLIQPINQSRNQTHKLYLLPGEFPQMAIKNMNAVAVKNSTTATRALDGDMTVDEFKEWLKRFDVNKDGRISRQELQHAIKAIRGRFSGWKSSRGIRAADTNGDGYVGEDEIDNLIDFAQKSLGLRIVAY